MTSIDVKGDRRGSHSDELLLDAPVAADLQALVDVVNAAFEHERWLIPGPRLREADAAHELLGPGGTTIVARERGTIVGSVRLRLGDERGGALATPELGLLAVHPAVQGRGVGSRLVRRAEAVARDAGFATLELRCGRELGLEMYYVALGYQIVGEDFGSRFGSLRPFTLVTLRRHLDRDDYAGSQ